MNPQPEQDLQRRLQKLEAELNQTYVPPPVPQQQLPQPPVKRLEPSQSLLNRFINWFNGLSGFGKLIVTGIAAIVGLAILRGVLTIVTAVITLALLGVLMYFLYQFLRARNSQTKD